MTKRKKENITKVKKARDVFLRGQFISKTQEVKGRTFFMVIRMRGLSDNRLPSRKEKKAAEKMAEYIVYGGMAGG